MVTFIFYICQMIFTYDFIPTAGLGLYLSAHNSKFKSTSPEQCFCWTEMLISASLIFFERRTPDPSDGDGGKNMSSLSILIHSALTWEEEWLFCVPHWVGDSQLVFTSWSLYDHLSLCASMVFEDMDLFCWLSHLIQIFTKTTLDVQFPGGRQYQLQLLSPVSEMPGGFCGS